MWSRRMRVRFGILAALVTLLAAWQETSSAGGVIAERSFRWRNDNGNEVGATWIADTDRAAWVTNRCQPVRLRFAVGNVDSQAGSTGDMALQYSTGPRGPWTAVPLTDDGLTPFVLSSSAWYDNGQLTTAQTPVPHMNWQSGGTMVESPATVSPSLSLGAKYYCNVEYSLVATHKARGGLWPYFFRCVTNSSTFDYPSVGNPDGGNGCSPGMMMGDDVNGVAPSLPSGVTVTGGLGIPFSQQLKAYGNEPITIRATSGLPPGLENSRTNYTTIDGLPTGAGTYAVNIQASNAWGTANGTLTVVITNTGVAIAPPTNLTLYPPSATPAAGGNWGCSYWIAKGTTPMTIYLRSFDQTVYSGFGQGGATIQIVTPPAHGVMRNFDPTTGRLLYLPDREFVGEDYLTYQVQSPTAGTSPTARVRFVVREPGKPAGALVLLFSTASIYAELKPEIDRMAADMRAEGWNARVVPWSGSGGDLWNYCRNEYLNTNQCLVGAFLLDTSVPGPSRTLQTLMHLGAWFSVPPDTYDIDIWASRMTSSDVSRLRNAYDANHYWRTGQARIPLRCYRDWTTEFNDEDPVALQQIWPDQWNHIGGYDCWLVSRSGAEFTWRFGHNDVTAGSFPVNARFHFDDGCGGGLSGPSWFDNRGGHMLFFCGSAVTWGAGNEFSKVIGAVPPAAEMLNRGDCLGAVMLAGGHTIWPHYYVDFLHWGDFTARFKRSPPNEVPQMTALSASAYVVAPGQQVTFTAAISDPDGNGPKSPYLPFRHQIEWFMGNYDAYANPTPARVTDSTQPNWTSVTYAFPAVGTYTVHVEVMDEWRARGYTEIGITVNRPPTAGNDTATVDAGQSVIIPVLTNDSDPDGQAIAVDAIAVAPGHGKTAISQDGIIYTATNNAWTGVDTFVYRIKDSLGSTAQATVTVTVRADTTPPTLTSVSARGSSTNVTANVTVCYSESVDPATATDRNNYAIDKGVSISGATLGSDGMTVTLTTSTLEGNVVYTLTVNNVRDLAAPPNTIAANSTRSFGYQADPSLVMYLKMDETSGIMAADSSGAGHNGSLLNGVSWASGRLGGGVRFDGVNDAIHVDLISAKASEVSLALWAKIDATNDPRGGLFFNGSGANGFGLFAGSQDGGDQTSMQFLAQVKYWHNTGVKWTVGQWQHWAVTIAAQNGNTVWRLYRDGVLAYTSPELAIPVLPTVNTTIGAEGVGGNTIPCTLDDVRFYERVLNAAEVAALANPGGSTNNPPVANAQSVTTDEDTAKAIVLTGNDPDGDPLTLAIATQPAHGTLSGTAPNVTYTPAANYNGVDSFTFRVNDPSGAPGQAVVSITVTAVNDAPVCSVTAPANGATLTAPATITIQANASDVDGTVAKVEFYQGATKLGETTTSPYAFTWSGVVAGSYTLTVKATDNSGAVTTSAGVNVVVVSGSSGNGYSVPIVFSGYNRAETLTNFPVLVKLGTNLNGFAYGQFLSTNGWDLRFKASDGVTELPYEIEKWDTSGASFVWVRVPILATGTYVTAKWGDSANSTQQPYTTNGAVWVNGYAGVWHLAGSGGTVSTRDSTSFANHMVNNGLVAVPGLVGGGVTNNGASSMSRAGAVTTTTPLTLSAWIKPSATDSKVVLTLMANNTWDGYYLQFYSTTGSVVTAANTTFKASEKAGRVGEWQYLAGVIPASNSRTVYLNGVAGNTESSTQTLGNTPNTTVIGDSGKGHWFNGLIDEARISSTARSANWIWAEYQNMASNAQFNSYGPVQGGGASSNRAPVVVDDAYSVAEDSTLTVATPGVLSNDTDADGDVLTAVKVNDPAHGTLTLNTNGSFTYTPAANWNGTDSFTYRASDGKTNSNVATVNITVTSVNDAPIANAQSVTTAEDTAKAITLTGSDPDSDPLTFAIVTGPAHGTLSGTAPNVTYTPVANYNGADTFTFKVNDGKVDSAPATVSIAVTAVNDAPVCSITAPANGATFTAPVSITIQANASDIDGTIAKVEFYQGATKLGEDTTSPYEYVWTGVAAGSYTLTVKATDNSGAVTTSAGVNVTVTEAVNGSNVTVIATCDNAYELYVNGVLKGTGNNWGQSQQYTAIPLQPGRNVIAIKGMDQGGVAGLLAETIIGGVRSGSSANWKVSLTGSAGWTNAVFDDGTWVLASDYGAYGVSPWAKNVVGMPSDTPARWIWSSDANNHDTVYFRCVIDMPGGAQNQPPVALAGVDPINGTTLDEYYFWGTDSYDPDGVVTSYQWTVNGVVGSTAAEFLWTFDVVGTYDVVLTVWDNKGASDSDLVQVQVTEPAVTVSVDVPDSMAGEPGLPEGSATIRVKRTGSTSAALTVNVALSGDASNGVDYAAVANTVVIPTGASYRDVLISPLADAFDESDEMVIMTVLPGTGYAVDVDASAGLVLIKDQTYGTPVVSAEATDALAKEPMQTTDKGAIKVSRTGSCHATLTVYCALGGTAVNGVDYSPVTVPVVLAVGQSSKVLTIAPLADGVVESNETVVLTLTTNAAYQIAAGKGMATVTIQDATVLTTPVVSVVATDADAQEPAGGVLNYGYIRFARTTRFHETLTVNCTVGGTASNGVDYVKVTVPIVFAVGEGIKDVSIRPIADGATEGVETAIFTLAAGTGYSVDAGKASATVSVRD